MMTLSNTLTTRAKREIAREANCCPSSIVLETVAFQTSDSVQQLQNIFLAFVILTDMQIPAVQEVQCRI